MIATKLFQLAAFLIIAMMFPLSSVAQESAPQLDGQAKALPPIVLKKCIAVEQVMGRNPLARSRDDFVLIKKYEERSRDAGAANPDPALNVYLVQSLVLKNRSVGVVYDNTLVVKVSIDDPGHDKQSIFEWILVDSNGDMILDHGFFRETTPDREDVNPAADARELPGEQLARLQNYYLNAIQTLDGRVGKGLDKACVVS